MIEFPDGLADTLRYARDVLGLSFDDVWRQLDLDREARAAGFGTNQQNAFAVETVLTFTKRHLRAAYERTEPLRYCDEDCPYLAVFDGHCAMHTTEERIASWA